MKDVAQEKITIFWDRARKKPLTSKGGDRGTFDEDFSNGEKHSQKEGETL